MLVAKQGQLSQRQCRSTSSRRQSRKSHVCKAGWTKVLTKDELNAAGGKTVVEVGGKKVLVAEVDGSVYAVSNKCTHLGLPLVGKTALFQGKVQDKCIVCPAHGTAFSLTNGEVVGPWCPGFPDIPFVGKGTKAAPLPTFEIRVDASGAIELNV